MQAIESAEKWIHFESYIIHDDRVGRDFADLLRNKARQGVKVRLIYDWLGAVGNAGRRFWNYLAAGGVDVRCFNPPKLDSPLGWISRDHRKLITVDGRVGFISGLCVGQRWMGYPEKKIDAWRDTGVAIEGPGLTEIEKAFADAWAATGDPLDVSETRADRANDEPGDTDLRIVATVPSTGNLYRVDLLIAALARRTMWLADAYFVGTTAYVQALCAASEAGVDVRLLVPGTNDVPVIRSVSRAGLRPLLESGVRVFEWNGSMMHAKTAVVDGHRARVGSTNLNLTSWLGNWELDVIVEDERFAHQMEKAYLDDISRSTEIVLTTRRRRVTPAAPRARGKRARRASGTRRAAAGVMRISRAVEAAITNRRHLGPAEAVIMFWGAALLTLISVVSYVWPGVLVYPVAVFCGWLALTLFIRAFKLRFRPRHQKR
jgi:cardiolipin synthase